MWWMLYGYYVMLMCGGQSLGFCKTSLRIKSVSDHFGHDALKG